MLKKTKVTRRPCVGDLRLTPLDIGFDVRLHDMAIALPDTFTSVGLDIGGDTYLIEGPRDAMITEIRAAGYRIAPAPKQGRQKTSA